MPLFPSIALWRVPLFFAKPKPKDLCCLPNNISDKIARDIGMSASELERHRFVWPSESPERPLL